MFSETYMIYDSICKLKEQTQLIYKILEPDQHLQALVANVANVAKVTNASFGWSKIRKERDGFYRFISFFAAPRKPAPA